MTVSITGATGFIGRRLVQKLLLGLLIYLLTSLFFYIIKIKPACSLAS